ncbi:MAG: ABC transporter substrate-binding protein [Armatimonadetes bacterium]|nr:ABC transporter substrate-binding protein [Armatimonadota bacterium]
MCVALGATTASADPLVPVTLQLKWKHQFQFAGYYMAQARGYYRDAGLDVRLVEADEQHDPLTEVISGRAQYGVGNTELVVERAKGQPVVVLAVIYQHSPLVLMARRDRGIRSPQDLVGKRVMLGPVNEGVELRAMLQREGVTLDRLVSVPTEFGLDALLSGKVDAQAVYITDEPFEAEQRKLPYVLLDARVSGVDLYGDNLFTSAHEIRRHPDQVARFREASLRGWREALARPTEAIDLILSRYSQRKTREQLAYEARETRRLVMPDVVDLGYMYTGRWQHITQVYTELGLLPQQPDLTALLYRPAAIRHLPAWFGWMLVAALLALALITAVALRFARLSRRLTRSEAAQRAMLDAAPVPVIITSSGERRVLYANDRAAELAGAAPDTMPGMSADHFFADSASAETLADRSTGRDRVAETELLLRRLDGTTFWALVSSRHWEFEGQSAVFAAFLDLSPQKVLQAGLETALEEVRTLRRLFPICCHCKKIRDDEGLWQQIDEYFAEHAKTAFTHGVCPDCLRVHYPGLSAGQADED